jgi:hypothetical protein
MIRHKSGTRWLDDWEVGWHHVRSASYTCRKREVWVSQLNLKTGGDGFLVWISKPRLTVW